MGKTWVADTQSGRVATGAYKPTGTGTAHQRLASVHGIIPGPHTVAGSIKPGGQVRPYLAPFLGPHLTPIS